MPTAEHPIRRETAHKLARYTLFSFIVTFVLSRICVFLIMSDEMPNFYFFVHGTHVHHLNYGIFLMAGVCGYSVFRRPIGRAAEITALCNQLCVHTKQSCTAAFFPLSKS